MRNPWLRRLGGVVGALALLLVLAWWLVPPLLKVQLETRGSAALGRALTVGAIDFKPWSLQLTVSDIAIATADGADPQMTIARVYVDAAVQSLWLRVPVLDALRLDAPAVHLTRLPGGHFDIEDLLARLASGSGPPMGFSVTGFQIAGGSVDFSDRTAASARAHTVRNLQMSVPFISNLATRRDAVVESRLSLVLDGSAVDLVASGTPFSMQVRKGMVGLQAAHLDLAPYLPYLPQDLPVQPRSAVLDTALTLAFAPQDLAGIAVSGKVKLSDVRLDDRTGAGLLSIEAIEAVLTEVRPLAHVATLESLTLTAPALQVARDRNARLNLAALMAQTPTPPATAEAAAPWALAIGSLRVARGRVDWTDAAVAPQARLRVDDAEVEVLGARWPWDPADQAPAKFQGRLSLGGAQATGASAPGRGARLQLEGSASGPGGTAQLVLSDVPLALAGPYLGPYLVPQLEGVLEGELQARWQGGRVLLGAPRLAVRSLALTPAAGQAGSRPLDLPALERAQVRDVQLDLAARSLTVGQVLLSRPVVSLVRKHDGTWSFSDWFPPAPVQGVVQTAPAAPTPPWKVAVASLVVENGSLQAADHVPDRPASASLSAVQVQLQPLSLDGTQPTRVVVSAQVAAGNTDPGKFQFNGTWLRQPMRLEGTVDASQLPLHAGAPYLAEHYRMELLRADGRFKGRVRYAATPQGPDLAVRGDAAVEDLRVNSALPDSAGSGASEELLNWKSLAAPGLDFAMKPGAAVRLAVRELSLADFFARLIINAEGRLVLQDLQRPLPPAVSPVRGPALAESPDPVVEVGPMTLVNGHIAFSDRFIKPNYSADLTELSGTLSRFSSEAPAGAAPGTVSMAALELRGRAEGSARLEVVGEVNPLARPLALDLRASVRDLELPPLSSYAVKYAGYGIERGRMSVDVNYSVQPGGALKASNRIILNQLTFGDKVEGSTSSLPVKLAVALLTDRYGVIDVDLPISGSLNDPQFSIWPVVWKAVGNLIVRALTSPFSLFSGGGGGDRLSTVVFAPGSSALGVDARLALDEVAKALIDRPALKMTVDASASLEAEREAMQRERLTAMLLAEKRRAAAAAGQGIAGVGEVTDPERSALLREVYRRADIPKPRNLAGLAKELPEPEMERLLLDSVAVNEDAVRALALGRALAVRDYLGARQVPPQRLFLGSTDAVPAATGWSPHAELTLSAQ